MLYSCLYICYISLFAIMCRPISKEPAAGGPVTAWVWNPAALTQRCPGFPGAWGAAHVSQWVRCGWAKLGGLERQEGRDPKATKRFSWVVPLWALAASQGLGNMSLGFVRCADTKLLGPCQSKGMATASHQNPCARKQKGWHLLSGR